MWGGGGATSKNRPTHHKSPKLFCESHTWRLVSSNTLRETNTHLALPFYLVFEAEKSNGSDEKSVKRKIA